jgi:hypothetical protein
MSDLREPWHFDGDEIRGDEIWGNPATGGVWTAKNFHR